MAKPGRRSKRTLWTNVAVFVGFVVVVILGFDTVEPGGGWVFAARALLTGARSHTAGVDSDPWLLAHHASTKLLIPLVVTHLVINRRWIVEDLVARSRPAA